MLKTKNNNRHEGTPPTAGQRRESHEVVLRNGRFFPNHLLLIQILRVLVTLWQEIWFFRTLLI